VGVPVVARSQPFSCHARRIWSRDMCHPIVVCTGEGLRIPGVMRVAIARQMRLMTSERTGARRHALPGQDGHESTRRAPENLGPPCCRKIGRSIPMVLLCGRAHTKGVGVAVGGRGLTQPVDDLAEMIHVRHGLGIGFNLALVSPIAEIPVDGTGHQHL